MPTIGNALNISQAGYQKFDGTSVFTGVNQIPLSDGGTNANLTASNGGIFYSTSSSAAILSGTSTANQILLSGASSTPIWSTATYPSSTTASQLLYSSSNNVVAGLGTANSAILATNSSGVPSITTASGNWLNTSRACFLATKASSTTNATGDGTTVTIVFGTVKFDQGSNYNNSTGVFTAPVTGKYMLCATVYFNNIGAGHTYGLLQIGTTANAFFGANNSPTATATAGATLYNMCIIANMSANDTASVDFTVTNSTKTITIFGDGSPITQFSGYLIC